MSHVEWFEAEGWITEDNAQQFMDSTIRGVFLPARHALFFYKGMGFFFDAAVVLLTPADGAPPNYVRHRRPREAQADREEHHCEVSTLRNAADGTWTR